MKLLLSKIWRWAFKSSLYLEESKSYGEFAIYLIIYMAAMFVFDFRWSMGVFHYLIWDPYWWKYGNRHKTKSLDSSIRKIFVIERFQLISMLIRSITQNAMDKKLCEILTVENVGIDTKTKYMESLIRKIFVIEWVHLISMLIRSITQNAMDNTFSIRQFPSPEHPYIVFPQKNLAVLDISRFTREEIGPQSRLWCATGTYQQSWKTKRTRRL